jgi:hypothetical protein
MSGEVRSLVVDLADAELVVAALDEHIKHYQTIDRASETSDSNASAMIRRAADARHQLQEAAGLFAGADAQLFILVNSLGVVALKDFPRDEFVEALRIYSGTQEPYSDNAKRSSYLADNYDG